MGLPAMKKSPVPRRRGIIKIDFTAGRFRVPPRPPGIGRRFYIFNSRLNKEISRNPKSKASSLSDADLSAVRDAVPGLYTKPGYERALKGPYREAQLKRMEGLAAERKKVLRRNAAFVLSIGLRHEDVDYLLRL